MENSSILAIHYVSLFLYLAFCFMEADNFINYTKNKTKKAILNETKVYEVVSPSNFLKFGRMFIMILFFATYAKTSLFSFWSGISYKSTFVYIVVSFFILITFFFLGVFSVVMFDMKNNQDKETEEEEEEYEDDEETENEVDDEDNEAEDEEDKEDDEDIDEDEEVDTIDKDMLIEAFDDTTIRFFLYGFWISFNVFFLLACIFFLKLLGI